MGDNSQGTTSRRCLSAWTFAALGDLWRDRRGVTAIEYGLIAAGIAVAIIVTLFALGGDVSALFDSTATEVSNAMGG